MGPSSSFFRNDNSLDIPYPTLLGEDSSQSTNRKLERRVKELSIQIDDEGSM